MAEIKHHKVVASLPSSLEANSVYYVRVGNGYDQYVTNSNGTVVAYESNSKLSLEGKVDKVEGMGLSEQNFTLVEKTKLSTLENYDDTVINNRLNAVESELDGKVDREVGKGLSSNDFTDPLYDKLVGLEGTHWRGTYPSLAALQLGVIDPEPGDYADVDSAGTDVERYIWDATDSVWVVQSGAVAPITASQVKLLYESNPDTNAFTDAEKAKLSDAVVTTDPRLTNAREWTATTVSQAEAEAGTATTARKWTAQRVRQAILGWWNGSADKTKLDGIQAGAQVNTVNSVAGKTGDVTLVKADVGLGSVDNTSDANKPISTATASALNNKVDKVSGKQLSTEDYTTAEKSKLSGIQAGAQVNVATNLGQGTRTATGIPLTSSTGTGTTLPIATTSLAGLQSAADKTKLDGIAAGATVNATDAQLRDRSTHTGTQPISSVTNLRSSLDSKVDKVEGYGLSQENYTPAEKSKLASIEGSKFKGEYVSLDALNAAHPSPEVGSYAYVDLGVGEVVSKYIWDSSDSEWVKQQGETAAALTPAEIKTLYEENPDTNAFTDSEKTKLSGIQAGATKNAADAVLLDRANHTGTQEISTVAGLQGELDAIGGLIGDIASALDAINGEVI